MSAPTATNTIQSPRRPSLKQRAAAPRRSCQVNLDLFDPFEFRGGTLCESETRRARTAIAACQSCPLLERCRAETAAVLDGTASRGVPPAGVVQAGILFTEDSKPYGHTPTPAGKTGTTSKSKGAKAKSKASETSADQYMFDFAAGLSDVMPSINGNEVEWVPDIDLSPPRLNHHGIHLALSDRSLEETVTRHRLNQDKNSFDPGVREILEYHDELEVVRLGVERGMALHRLAANLRTTWHRVDRLCGSLGITAPHRE